MRRIRFLPAMANAFAKERQEERDFLINLEKARGSDFTSL
jgi:hypothetical protein